MRKYIQKSGFTFVLSLIISLNVLAQDPYTNTTIHTPKNSPLTAWTLTGDDMSSTQKNYWKNYYLTYYDNRITFESEATISYNCHGFAWHVSEGGDEAWIGLGYVGGYNHDQYPEEVEDIYWDDESYIEVPYQSWASKVSFGTANHSAITTGITNWFTSKWGAMPLFSHSKDDCPYDDSDLHYYAKNNAAISGPSDVCPSSTEFSVANLLPGATISWSTSSNITRISSQGSNPCQFAANENGEMGWIDATFTFNGIQYALDQKNVWVGSDLQYPVWLEIKGENYEFIEHTNDMWEICPNTIYRLQAHAPGISQWDWTFPGDWELLSEENSPEILIETGDYIYWEDEVHVDVYNSSCSEWLYYADYLLVTEPPYGCGELLQFNLYPNPAKNNVIIQMTENNFIYDSNYTISIVDKSGRVTIKKITKEHIHNLDISNLQNGEYTIVISNGRFAKSKTFIKNN